MRRGISATRVGPREEVWRRKDAVQVAQMLNLFGSRRVV